MITRRMDLKIQLLHIKNILKYCEKLTISQKNYVSFWRKVCIDMLKQLNFFIYFQYLERCLFLPTVTSLEPRSDLNLILWEYLFLRLYFQMSNQKSAISRITDSNHKIEWFYIKSNISTNLESQLSNRWSSKGNLVECIKVGAI